MALSRMPSPRAIDAKTEALTDEAIVVLLQGGQRSALNALMARYKTRLFSFILRHVNDEEAAYDLVQETFTRVYFKANQFNPSYKFSTWVYTIALNLCRDHRRRNAWTRLVSLSPATDQDGYLRDALVDDRADTERTVSMKRQLARLSAGLGRLPESLRAALLLYAVEGHSQQECAAILRISEKSVETRVYRARKRLLAWMQQQ